MALITVSTLIDENDGNISAGNLSLREAVGLAVVGDTINFDAALASGTILLNSELVIQSGKDLTIDADNNNDGIGEITVSGNNQTSLFSISSGATATLDALIMADGMGLPSYGYGYGYNYGASAVGAINNRGTLTLDGVQVSNNTGTGSYGGYAYGSGGTGVGAIMNSGTLTILDSVFSGNTGRGASGGSGAPGGYGYAGGTGVGDIRNGFGATLTMTDTVFSGGTGLGGFGGSAGIGGTGGDGGDAFASLLNFGTASGTATITAGTATGGTVGVGGMAGTVDLEYFSTTTNDPDLMLFGSTADETLSGGAGVDVMRGLAGSDVLNGGSGDDVLRGGSGTTDTLNGDDGTDMADYADAGSGLVVDLQNTSNNTDDAAGDVFSSIEDLRGSFNDDSLRGNAGDNTLYGIVGNDFVAGRAGDDMLFGNSGDDILRGGLGADSLLGGSGEDQADYADATEDVRADLANSTLNLGIYAVGDTYQNIENIRGSNAGDDSLRGDAQDNVLQGLAGDDTLIGRSGNDTLAGGAGTDTLVGGSGNDVLIGGGGADVFIYTAPTQGVDSMIGFTASSDVIHLHESGFTAFSAGALVAANFHLGTAAADADDYLIYDGVSLFYDADGSGSGAQVELVRFNNGAALDEGDFLIV